MKIRLDRAQLRLGTREVIRLYDPIGARVECVRGALWITQDRDREDYFLAANDALTLDRKGLALIHAQEPSEIILSEPAPIPPWTRARGALAAALHATGRWIARRFGPEGVAHGRLRGWHGAL